MATNRQKRSDPLIHEEENQRMDIKDTLLKGHLPLEKLPHLKSRVVRVFISSTFTDMGNERNEMMSKVYPKLRAYCRKHYNMEFHAVDMRWGVMDGATDDHSTAEICMDEIVNCQRHSVGPNFVAFVGQKYGYVDVPSVLPCDQFEAIRAVVIAEMKDNDIDLLDQWFKRDENSKPAAYILQPISSILGSDKKNKWDETAEKLKSMLSSGAEKAGIPEEVMANIKASITEQELQCGILDVQSTSQKANILCFIREIVDIEHHLESKKAHKFIDKKKHSKEVDLDKQKALNLMKEKLRTSLLPPNLDTLPYTEKWSDPHGISSKSHERYLRSLKKTFYQKMCQLIDRNVSSQAEKFKGELYEEALQHWDIAKMRCKNFLGRNEILEQISTYVSDETNQPLIVHGKSGYGKTSIIAKAASEINIDKNVVLRFCGTSVQSSKIRLLLISLSDQLVYINGKKQEESGQIPKDLKRLKTDFKELVQSNWDQKIVIFIDAVNQLSFEDGAHKLDWLPTTLGEKVKIIISLISGDSPIYQKLKSKVTRAQQYIEVEAMTAELCLDVIKSCLKTRGRQISDVQWKLVTYAVDKCTMPLFAKLTFEMVLDWKSYMDIPQNVLTTSVSAAIQELFQKLEKKHGKMLVSHALAYITASQGGISEVEMEDLLSLDDLVLNSVFTHWDPPSRRIPTILFPRIKHDIKEYLVDRDCDETTVIYWYHSQFIEAAKKCYLSQLHLTENIHDTLSHYFKGTYANKKKGFQYTVELARRIGIKSIYEYAMRFVPEQPVFHTYKNEKKFNFRKLNQMPYHLAKAQRLEDLKTHVYFNFEFLHTKLSACSIQRLISDFSLVEDHEVSIVADALRMSEAALTIDKDLLGVELSGRLLPHYDQYKNIHSLIKQCDHNSLHKCPVVPNYQVFTTITPGGPLQYVCEADASISKYIDVQLIQSDDDMVLLTAKPFDGTKMRVWNITQDERQPDIDLPAQSRPYFTPDGVYVNCFKDNKCLQTFRMDSGEQYGEVNIDLPQYTINQVGTGNKYLAFTYSNVKSPLAFTYSNVKSPLAFTYSNVKSPGVMVIDIEGHQIIDRFNYWADSVAISDDGRFLATNHGKILTIHSLPNIENMKYSCSFEISRSPEKMIFSSDPSTFYVQDAGHELICIRMNPSQEKARPSASVIFRKNKFNKMKDFKLSHNGELILVRASHTLHIFDTITEDQIYKITSMPSSQGEFIGRPFKQAVFTYNDKLIVAAIDAYLGIWSAKDGKPLRLLRPVIPVVSLYTSDTVNQAVTLLQDHTIQVWNLDNFNLDSNVKDPNRTITQGSIKCLSSSSNGDRLVCCGKDCAEGKVINLNKKQIECEWTLEHTDAKGKELDDVMISPCGRFAVTRMENKDYPGHLQPWRLLKEDKLWNLTTGESVMVRNSSHFLTKDASDIVPNSRHVMFSPSDDKVVFFICDNYSTYDWSIISYSIRGMSLTGDNIFVNFNVSLPKGDVIGKPTITSCSQFLAFILQSKEGFARYNNKLMIYSFEKLWSGLRSFSLTSIENDSKEKDIMIDLKPYGDDRLLITYGHNLGHLKHTSEGVYERNIDIHKSSFVYSIRNNKNEKQMKKFLDDGTNIDRIILSNHNKCILDQKAGKVFSMADNTLLNTLNLSNVLSGSICLILDGNYVAMLSSSRRELLLDSTSEGRQIARIFLHCPADCIQTAHNNDRIIIVGCSDGTVMCFSVVLELINNQMQAYINSLPSRKSESNVNSNNTQRSKSASITTNCIVNQKRRQSLKSVGTAVTLSNMNKTRSSQACVLL